MRRSQHLRVKKEVYNKTENDQVTGDSTKAGDTHQIGDKVEFKIGTAIPLYTSDYKNPKFEISDTLSTGLKLDQTSIKVYNGDPGATTLLTENTDYTIENKTETGFTVKFAKTFLLNSADKSKINVTYKAQLLKRLSQDLIQALILLRLTTRHPQPLTMVRTLIELSTTHSTSTEM